MQDFTVTLGTYFFETGNALQKVKQFSREKSFPFRYLMDEPLKGAVIIKPLHTLKCPVYLISWYWIKRVISVSGRVVSRGMMMP
jgi:hypothetical protein